MVTLKAVGLLILLLLTAPALAQNHALLVDSSGSMKPYHEQGLISDLGSPIRDVMRRHGSAELLSFSTGVVPVPSFEAMASSSQWGYTYIDRAIDHAIHNNYAIAWIITDNVQHQAGAAEEGNTEVFYRKLRGDAVKKVIIFPLLQSPGMSGLVIYAILLSPDANDVFEKEITEFLADVRGVYRTEALRMKPLDRETIEINVVRGNLRPNKNTVVYKESQNINETLDVRFKSRFEHLKVVDAKVSAAPGKAEFGSASLLKPEKRDIDVTPERVPSLNPQAETDEVYQVKIDLGKVKLKKDLISLWKAAWEKSGEDVVLNLSLMIEVPQRNFKFKDQFLNTYNARNPETAKTTGKIYGIETLPLLLGETSTSIVTEQPLPLRIEYPWWPAFMWIVLFVLGGAVLIGAAVVITKGGTSLFTRPGKWSVEAETERQVKLQSEVDEQGIVRIRGEEAGSIAKNKFIPSGDVSVEGGEEQVKLEDGLRRKIEFKGNPVILIFKAVDAAEKDQEQISAYTPEKR